MAAHRYITIDDKEAELLASLEGILGDLDNAMTICERLEKELSDLSNIDFTVLEALNWAVLMKYARPFVGGVRAKIPEPVIEELTPEMKDDHEYFMDLRGKYIAHSVSALEENTVRAYLNPEEEGKQGVSHISVHRLRFASLSIDEVKELKSLCNYFVEKLQLLIEDEKRRVLEYLRSLPTNELYRREKHSRKALTREDAGKQRKH